MKKPDFSSQWWWAPTILFWVVLLLLVVGCSPQKRLNRIIKKNPELSTTKTITETDTLEVPRDRIVKEFETVTDTAQYYELLEEYVRVATMVGGLEVELEKEKRKTSLRQQIRETIFPDTTFTVLHKQQFAVEDSIFSVESKVKVTLNSKGAVGVDYDRSPVKIPYTKHLTTTNVDARVGKPFYKDLWFWLLLIALVYIFRKQLLWGVTNHIKRPF